MCGTRGSTIIVSHFCSAGLEDGKVRALNTKTNKSQNLYEMQSSVVSLASNERGNGFICGHEDGTITRYYINEDSSQVSGRLIQHPTCPVAVAWPNGFIVAAGCDRKIVFYDSQVICESRKCVR